MLNAEEKREIEGLLAQYEDPSAGCIEALKVVQEHRGWVSDENLLDVAATLAMTPAEVEGVATFYNLIFRRPVGRHVILLCDSVSCWINGYESLLAHLEKRLGITFGETTADGAFTLLPVPCLGACDRSPALLLDGELHGNLTAETLDRLLTERRPEEKA